MLLERFFVSLHTCVNGRYICGLDNCKLQSFFLFSLCSEAQSGQLAASSPCTFGRKTGKEELLVFKSLWMKSEPQKLDVQRWEGGRGINRGEEQTDTESVLGWEFTRGVEKAHHLALQKNPLQNFAIQEAGVGKQDTKEYSQCLGIKKDAVSSSSSPLCLGRVSPRWSRFTVWRCIGSCWQRQSLWW